MTETTKNTGEKLSVTSTKTLTLKRGGVEQGVVRQSFSHGRSKAVVVEKVKRRIAAPGETKPDAALVQERAAALKRPAPTAKAPAAAPEPAPSAVASQSKPGVVLRPLTQAEISARASALGKAELVEVEERKRAEADADVLRIKKTAEEKERREAEARKTHEAERRAHEDKTKQKATEVANKRFGAEATLAKPGAARVNQEEEEEAPRPRRGPGGAIVRPAPAPKPQRTVGEKRRGRLTVVTAFSADEVRERSDAAFRRRERRRSGLRDAEPKEKIVREVIIPETITIQDLANRMSERSVDVVRMLMKQGHMATSTDTIDADTAQLIAEELGHTVRRVSEADVEEGMFDVADDPEKLLSRAPVVTIMGHVDHGKTSLLDAIRSTEVAAGEAGGITQHIGAYQVTSPSGGRITFIDTPGHAAFTAMRARGAKITDIVVLVVAADDGVMPQTVEAIQHAKAASVPIIVAINKIDRPDAKPERVRTELLQYEIQVESLGGDVLEVDVSAKEKTNLDKLLDIIALQAEVLQLKANPNRAAEGTVIEARLDRGRGPVATVLVQRGTLKPGDIVVAGAEWGRVRALMSDTGHSVVAAGPSMPVEVLGFNGTPEAGDRLAVVDSEARAREITAYRERQKREKMAARQTGMRGSLEQMMKSAQDRRAQGIPARDQGRRAGVGRGDPRRTGKTLHGRGHRARIVLWRRRDHRIRRDAGGSIQCRHHRLQRSRPQGSARSRERRPASKSATTISSTASSMTLKKRCRACCRRRFAKPCWATRQFWKSSRFPRSAPSPAAASPMAPSNAARMCGSFAIASLCIKASCRNSNVSRTMHAKSSRGRNAAWHSRIIRI